ESLGGGDWEIGPDHIEVGSFIGLAAITGSDVTIDGVKDADLVSILHAFEKLGVRVEQGDGFVRVPPRQELVVQDDLGGHVPKIEDGPWPAFPSDLTSVALTVATQADGTILMFAKMFENRLFFTDKLVSMGARIILCDPHRAAVTGPSKAATGQGRASARVNVAGRGETNVATGVPVLDHLLSLLAVYASFDLALEVEPGSPEIEITAAARSLADALAQPLRAEGVRGH